MREGVTFGGVGFFAGERGEEGLKAVLSSVSSDSPSRESRGSMEDWRASVGATGGGATSKSDGEVIGAPPFDTTASSAAWRSTTRGREEEVEGDGS
jgi:hypothetical protein